MALWQGHHGWQQWQDRQQLQLAHAKQQPTVDAAAKLRAGLDSVATATAALAAQGNTNAATIVTELRKSGITINTNPTTATAP
jgi:hypothetical protein